MDKDFEESGGGGGLFHRFPLDTSESARQSFARLIRAYAKGKIDRTTYHELVYGLSAYFNALKTAREDSIDNRLLALEEAIEDAYGPRLERSAR